ncbi:MAG: hypothetical protein ACT4PL_02250 [Phycisphaerales bacterium]
MTHAPGTSPSTTSSAEVEWTEPPKWPTVVGVISIILGSLWTLCGLCAPFGPMIAANAAPGQELPPTMRFGTVMWVCFATGWISAIVLLAGGILCLRRRIVTRWLHLAYALHAFIVTPITTYYQLEAQSRMKAWAAANPKSLFAAGADQPGVEAIAVMGAVVGVVLSLAYPLFVAFWFGVFKRTQESMLMSAPPKED